MTLNVSAPLPENPGTPEDENHKYYDPQWLAQFANALLATGFERKWDRHISATAQALGKPEDNIVRLAWGLVCGYRQPPSGMAPVDISLFGAQRCIRMFADTSTEAELEKREPRVAALLGITVAELRAKVQAVKAAGRKGLGLV